MYCPNCGNELSRDAKFCTKCGVAVETSASPQIEAADPAAGDLRTGIGSVSDGAVNHEDLALFVGKNSDKYLKKWGKILDSNKRYTFSWHWPAFLISPFWYAYRKMYLYAAIWAALDLVAGLMSARLSILGVAVGVLSARYANQLYLQHAKRNIREIRSTTQDRQEQITLIKRRGRTSGLALTLSIIIYVAAIITELLIQGSFNPAYGNSLTVGTTAHNDSSLSVSGTHFVAGGRFYFNITDQSAFGTTSLTFMLEMSDGSGAWRMVDNQPIQVNPSDSIEQVPFTVAQPGQYQITILKGSTTLASTPFTVSAN